eukprot:GHRR01023994.1.p1 GENE.GHRR01023994.1~~GHRR01023994.1.p1  ORF type:complete len:133 (-),score=10.72 GHRR01023994.1:618-1016(-)
MSHLQFMLVDTQQHSDLARYTGADFRCCAYQTAQGPPLQAPYDQLHVVLCRKLTEPGTHAPVFHHRQPIGQHLSSPMLVSKHSLSLDRPTIISVAAQIRYSCLDHWTICYLPDSHHYNLLSVQLRVQPSSLE